jgi:hypothetical protein
MLVALGTNVKILFKIFLPNDLATIFTLNPEPLGTDFLLPRGIELSGLTLEPGH